MDARRRSAAGAAACSSALAGLGRHGSGGARRGGAGAVATADRARCRSHTLLGVAGPGHQFSSRMERHGFGGSARALPDGRALVFVGAQRNDRPMLWLRSMDDVEPRPIAGRGPIHSGRRTQVDRLCGRKDQEGPGRWWSARVISESENNPSGPRGVLRTSSCSAIHWTHQEGVRIGGPIEHATALQLDRKE